MSTSLGVVGSLSPAQSDMLNGLNLQCISISRAILAVTPFAGATPRPLSQAHFSNDLPQVHRAKIELAPILSPALDDNHPGTLTHALLLVDYTTVR